LLLFPLRLVPNAAYSTMLAFALNRVLEEQMAQGELEFLSGKRVCLRIDDAHMELRVTLGKMGFAPVSSRHAEDVRISGNLVEFHALAMRDEDPDTLFFNRRLKIEGSTAVGLQLKNFLDSIELPIDRLPAAAKRLLEQSGAWLRQADHKVDPKVDPKVDQSAAAASAVVSNPAPPYQ
jgi:predicted lipid carrier protein YhbT